MTALHEITGYPYASNPLHDWKYERQFVNMSYGDVSDNSCSAYLAARATLRAKRIAAELELRALIGRLMFVYARTMPEAPHEYCVKTVDNTADYDLLYQAIQQHGRWEKWQGRRYRYLYVGGWRYWVMGPRKWSFLINRARVEGG